METAIEYRLPDPSLEQYTWTLQDEHTPASATPLLSGARASGMFGQPKPGEPPLRIQVNGFSYARQSLEQSAFFRQAQPPESVEDLTRWRVEWLPQAEKAAEMLEGFAPASVGPGAWEQSIGEQEKEFGRIFTGVHSTAVLPARLAASKFQAAFEERFGEERRQDAIALLQGFPNRSLDRASALWELGRILRADEGLLRALDRMDGLPTGSPAAREFQQLFQAMLQEFGCTTDNGQQDLPTWREGSPVPLAMARAYARQEDSRSPSEAARHQQLRRLELERELHGAASSDPSVASLIPLMEMAQQLMPNLEDHNLLSDQRMGAASRARWLAVGRHLQQQGLASSPDDVFYFYRPELFQALEGGAGLPSEEVQRRRRLQELYRSSSPPPTLGKTAESSDPEEDIPEEAHQGRTVRGVAASAGSYRGRARVVESLAEAGRLEEGDVLVTRSTTPPWTPYFGVAGALVTNVGGALSHTAVVAREFGIPAVVGTRNGTGLIPDGATVTVDGTTGLVLIE